MKRNANWPRQVLISFAMVFICATSTVNARGENTVAAWGYNGFGQTNVPVNLGACKQVDGGGNQTVALRSNNSVIAWGSNQQGQCNVPLNLGPCTQVTAGTNHTAAIRQNGILVAWGDNSLGQCGNNLERVGGRTNDYNSVNGAAWVKTTSLGPCKLISAGANHTLAIRQNGIVAAWGYNIYGQCGIPAENTGYFGIWTKSALGTCTQIAGGANFSLALQTSGFVAAWGYNASGQCGPANERVAGSGMYWVRKSLGYCQQISAGGDHALALRSDGRVIAWGSNTYGQCNVPQTILNCVQTAAGFGNSLALQSDGLVVAWGLNTSGQSTVPTNLGTCVSVAAGDFFSLAIQGTPPPTNVTASNGSFTNQVAVRWGGVSGASSYFVFRVVNGSAAIHIGTTTSNTFTDFTGASKTKYTYFVKASSMEAGTSALSFGVTGWRK